MPEEQPWVDDALLEFVTFPAAKNDDRVDAASQALLWLQGKRSTIDGEFFRSMMAINEGLVRPSEWKM